MKKGKRGVTLIALVVTIVVLIILAAVSINVLLGENGIIYEAQNAKEKQEIVQLKEEIDFAWLNSEVDAITKQELMDTNFQRELYQQDMAASVITDYYDNTLVVVYKNYEWKFKINEENGKLELVEAHKIDDMNALFELSASSVPTLRFRAYGDKYYSRDDVTEYDFPIENIVVPSTFNGKKVVAVEEMGAKNVKSITISEGIEEIGEYFCLHAISLTEVNIPNTVISIKNYAFLGCTSLETITIPNSVTVMNEYLFERCPNLKQIIIQEGSSLTIPSNKWGAPSTCEVIKK